MDGQFEAAAIQDWYQNLPARTVDLVGDYAGSELFLIEGDSLLFHCFSDRTIDLEDGFQLLHAVYAVEKFLAGLLQRKCNFHLVFFARHSQLCLPPRASIANHAKYLLAREAVVQHLQDHLPGVHPSVKISVFESLDCNEFQLYLQSSGMYFMMVHDGAHTRSPETRSNAATSDQEFNNDSSHLSSNKVAFRSMILFFIRAGYNVALINSLSWMDTKVIAMVLEGSRRSAPESKLHGAINVVEAEAGQDLTGEQREQLFGVSKQTGLPLSQRIWITTEIVGRIVKQDPTTAGVATMFLLHTALLCHLPLHRRICPDSAAPEDMKIFLQTFARATYDLMCSTSGRQALKSASASCDVADLADGRLFYALSKTVNKDFDITMFEPSMMSTFSSLCEAITSIYNVDLSVKWVGNQTLVKANCHLGKRYVTSSDRTLKVMPFSNPVFDKHLSSIRLAIDVYATREISKSSAKVFKDATHWHNTRPVLAKCLPSRQQQQKRGFFALRREQWLMAEMRTYAASLTNAVGKVLEPETVIAGKQPNTKVKGLKETQQKVELVSRAPARSKEEVPTKPSKKNAIIAANAAQKGKSEEDKLFRAWDVVRQSLDPEADMEARYSKAKAYLGSLPDHKRQILGLEVECYLLNILVEMWIRTCRAKRKDQGMGIAALIWELVVKLSVAEGLTKTLAQRIQATSDALKIHRVKIKMPSADRKLSYGFPLPTSGVEALEISISLTDFQLMHCGPYYDRSIDSSPDHRVPFNPDGWQKRVLDEIDANRSLFVVAPTSAGKTFISFYAMKKILQAGDEDVLVYVAPTKALVNQIAAEVQARFSKSYKHAGKSVWAVHTRDYRINEPTSCQILITVPHILQIMLLGSSNAKGWSTRVKRIIFDEIHSIGQADDGIVWEQLLLLAPCPIIALSATVGNPQQFHDWLASTQASSNIDLTLIQHAHRYSDLRKYVYVTPKTFVFDGLPDKRSFSALGLEGSCEFAFVHPIASLINKSRGMPDDLGLEARDCLTLWRAMSKYGCKEFPISDHLDPSKYLPQVIRKIDIIRWEKDLKDVLRKWMTNALSPFDNVVAELSPLDQNLSPDRRLTAQGANDLNEVCDLDIKDLRMTTLPLLIRLHELDALPAILFNYDRNACEIVARYIVSQLHSGEEAFKASSSKWKAKLEGWQQWKDLQARIAKKQEVSKPKKSKTPKRKSENDDDGPTNSDKSNTDAVTDAASAETSRFASFNPDAPVDGFHFADHRKLLPSELNEHLYRLERRGVSQWLMDTLKRGIGVHHAGMNRVYRQAVEILFRKGFLRVVIATGTLALGINMPCKTVVFSGDSVFLTALNYRQAAGRAGRRGFDLLGNVVFHGLTADKVYRLLSSRLPDLNGHFPITTTLVLRLFTLLHDSEGSAYAKKAIDSLLSQPRLYLGGQNLKEMVLHHLRFSIEYLRRQYLLSSSGAPLNFAGCVSHLYFTENSSFAFHALLKEGFFHELCERIESNKESILLEAMLVMAHLFGRRNCRQADQEFIEKTVKRSPSVVFLPPLPKKAATILRKHNQDTLDVFYTYVKTFVDQHVTEEDCILPLTRQKMGGDAPSETFGLLGDAPKVTVRSAFVALSGHGDDFQTISELCRTSRDEVFLEESVIPHVDIFPDETSVPLNAYLLDFYKHGDITALEEANGIRRGEMWFILNDFSLVLATIVTSLKSFMKLSADDELDMMDVMGGGDAHEESEDDKVAAVAAGAAGPANTPQAGDDSTVKRGQTAHAKKPGPTPENWTDDLAEIDSDSDSDWEPRARRNGKPVAVRDKHGALEEDGNEEDDKESLPAWEDGGQGGLLNVLKAFEMLKEEFDAKFKKMWA